MSLTEDRRPSPDALLAVAKRQARGKLKIFLGAAPGVGKTYEMLQAARKKLAEGIDVVIGVVETHGRSETAALLADLEAVPRRRVDYQGRVLEEMDLDAVLTRRPTLVLVDELAHTNAPGGRHPKRYLDVEELLAAGIDVYSTLNVQHVESLNDVVARITRIRVRETVPDSILEAAHEIELVDTTPDDLIQRLREGKVYVREQAHRALNHFFAPGNLTALRELALRQTAARVDEQVLEHMRSRSIEGPWPTDERLLVCIGPSPQGANLIRAAKRQADRLRAPWIALYVETTSHAELSEQARARVADTLRLAERLGAETVTIPGRRVANDVLDLARARNVTRILVGRSERSRWFELWHGSVVNDLVRKAGDIAVVVTTGERALGEPPAVRTTVLERRFEPGPYAASLAMAAMATAIGRGIEWLVVLPNISLVYVAVILLSAWRHGLWPSVVTALASVAAYNFFFIPPLYTFTIADPANYVALVFFLIVAVLTSMLATRARDQTITAQRQARTTADLYAFSRKLAAIADLDDLLWATAHQIAAMLKVEVVLLLPSAGRIAVRAGFPPEDTLDDADLAAATWTWDHDTAAGRGADTLPGARRLFLPLKTERGRIGVIGILRGGMEGLLTPAERQLLDALSDQAAVAIERIQLARDVDEARLREEGERLRAALLTSVSHDLKTPLASIIGSISSLRSYADRYDAATRGELLANAQEEAERLGRFVGNLLDMTRLDGGALRPKRDSVDPAELVDAAVRRAGPLLARHRVALELPADLPSLVLDFALTEQALFNLLDNAAKYAPEGSVVTISGRGDASAVEIAVIDEGPGIPPADLDRVFDKFFRAQGGDRQRAGTGLGLAIARGFVAAQGGSLVAANRTDRSGVRFVLRFPR